MTIHKYLAYGLTVASTLILPELVSSCAHSDISIRQEALNWRPPHSLADDSFFQATATEAFLYWEGVGACRVRAGQEIAIDPIADADVRSLRLLVLNAALTILMQQRGCLVLHGSAVAMAGHAIVFLGVSGQGKSTLAAALYRQGYSVVTDDVVVIDLQSLQPMVLPGFPQLRLLPDAAVALGYDLAGLPLIHPWIRKHALRVEQHFSPQPLPLGHVYELTAECLQASHPLTHQAAFLTLTRHYHHHGVRWIQATRAEHQLLRCGHLIGRVPIYRLRAANNLGSLSTVVRVVEEQVCHA